MRFTKDEMDAPVLVVAVTPGGPAAQAGIVPRLLIHEIDGVATAGLGQREVGVR
jgi:S1-C subfamily serine protease